MTNHRRVGDGLIGLIQRKRGENESVKLKDFLFLFSFLEIPFGVLISLELHVVEQEME